MRIATALTLGFLFAACGGGGGVHADAALADAALGGDASMHTIMDAAEDAASATDAAVAPDGSTPPLLSDTFSSGTLDTTKWVIDTGSAPGNIAGVNSGTFSTASVSLAQGMLALELTQTGSAPVISTGAEVRSVKTYGFGVYEWVYRTSSTATTPNGAGSAKSGSDSGGFTFINDSETEIDFETEGQLPNTIEMTSWQTTANDQETNYTLTGPDQGFHHYKFDWQATKIDFYVDGTLVSTHTQHIPSTPAYVLMNHWGTNSTSFGGLATTGAARYLYISSFSFTPH